MGPSLSRARRLVRPDVSVMIVTRNGGPILQEALEAISDQETAFRFEIVAVDSGSTDGTLDVLRRFGARVRCIQPAEFNHGTTRNLGIKDSRGEFVVLLVQDAVPASARWLSSLVAPLATTPDLAGSYARQIPRADASPLTRYYLSRWIATSEVPRIVRLRSSEAFEGMAPIDRFLTCVFDNVCSCVRRSVWRHTPFPRTDIAEDLEWARDVLRAGHGVAYVPESAVIHSHERPARYELMRTYLVHKRLRSLFDVATIPDLRRLLYAIATTLPLHATEVLRTSGWGTHPRELARALALAVAFPLGQYLGVRATDTGRELLRPRGV